MVGHEESPRSRLFLTVTIAYVRVESHGDGDGGVGMASLLIIPPNHLAVRQAQEYQAATQ